MKVAQNDETNPDTQPVRPPHTPNISNSQLSPSGSSARKRETPGILSRMLPPFTGITPYCVRSQLARALPCYTLIALLFIVFPLRYFFPVDTETDAAAAAPIDYVVDDPSFLSEQPGKPPPLITRYRLLSSILLALE